MFWKIFSGIWLCSWKYHRKHIFYLLHTFSHIFSAVKQIYNIIPQYRNTKETKPRKKKFIKFGQIERRRKREVRGAAIGAVLLSLLDRRGAIGSVCGLWTRARSKECAFVVVGLELCLRTRLSLCLALCVWVRKWFEVKIFTSNYFRVKAFKTHGQLKINYGKFIFHA